MLGFQFLHFSYLACCIMCSYDMSILLYTRFVLTLRHATRLVPLFSLYNVSSRVRAMLHGVSGKVLVVWNHRTD